DRDQAHAEPEGALDQPAEEDDDERQDDERQAGEDVQQLGHVHRPIPRGTARSTICIPASVAVDARAEGTGSALVGWSPTHPQPASARASRTTAEVPTTVSTAQRSRGPCRN